MNKYEQNFKEQVNWLIQALESEKVELKAKELTIESIEQDLASLSKMVTDTPILSELIDTRENQLNSFKHSQEVSKALIDTYLVKLKIFQQICPHENTVYDHTKQHKNEDYHRCTLCNKLI